MERTIYREGKITKFTRHQVTEVEKENDEKTKDVATHLEIESKMDTQGTSRQRETSIVLTSSKEFCEFSVCCTKLT